MEAIPELKTLNGSHKDQGLVLISIHSDEDAQKGAAKANEMDMTWPVAQDEGDKTQAAYGVEAYPTTVVIDKQGKVRYSDPDDLESAVNTLLKEK